MDVSSAGAVTVAVVVLSLALAAAIASNVVTSAWLRTARAEVAAEAIRSATYRDERNAFAVSNANHVKRTGELESMLRATSALLKDADRRNAEQTVKEIVDAPSNAAAADAFVSVFSVPILPDLPKAGDAGTGSDSGGTGGVPPP